MTQNTRLAKNKRKAEEHMLHFPAFKKGKLDHVGDGSKFGTDKVNQYEDHYTGGLTMGFTDLITKLPMYKTLLTTNIAPYWTNPEIDRVTRSWNDD